MRLFRQLSVTIAALCFASSAFAGSYLCASWQAFNADLSQALAIGGSKCIVSDGFIPENTLFNGLDTKDGADIAAMFKNVDDIVAALQANKLTVFTPETLDSSAFFLIASNQRCLGTNMSSSMPKLDKIGNNQCWIFHVSQD